MASQLVEPIGAATAAPVEPSSPQPSEEAAASLSPEILQIPAMQGILAGEPAAFSVPIAGFEARPEGKIIISNKDPLMQAGIGFYRSLGGDIGAIFNRFFLADTEIQQADKEGRLAEIAPSFEQVNQMISQSGQQNPMFSAKQRPTGIKSAGATVPVPGPVANVSQPAAAPTGQRTPARLLGAKMRNLDVGSPTEGSKPGAGRLLNSILKPVL